MQRGLVKKMISSSFVITVDLILDSCLMIFLERERELM